MSKLWTVIALVAIAAVAVTLVACVGTAGPEEEGVLLVGQYQNGVVLCPYEDEVAGATVTFWVNDDLYGPWTVVDSTTSGNDGTFSIWINDWSWYYGAGYYYKITASISVDEIIYTGSVGPFEFSETPTYQTIYLNGCPH